MTDECWETPLIFNDQPLQPARKQKTYFQFENYARTFARLIASADTRTPLTIGINGDWGSGKTTLMRAIQAQLDESTERKERPAFIAQGEVWPDEDRFRPVRTVWFNAWKYSHEDALFVALVEEVLREMRRDGTLSRIYASLSDPKAVRLRVPETVLSTVSQVFTMGQVDLDLSRFESESRFKANLAFLDEFRTVFDRLVRWWVYKDLKEGDVEERETDDKRGALAIFIDDLDRCLPEKTVQVLESIKLMMDCPGIVFVIGASRRIVQAAVKTHYRAFDELQGESARYLDKIIQVPFNLPPLQPEGDQSLDEFLDELGVGRRRLAETNPSLIENLRLLTRGGETNPRRIKTFVNYAELQWALLANARPASIEVEPDREHFNRWMVLTEAGGERFRAWLEQLPRHERPVRVREAIAYAQRARAGRAEEEKSDDAPALDPNLQQMIDGSRRLRGVLGQLERFDIDPDELHLYIHLCAPPVEETVSEVTPRPSHGREGFTLGTGDEEGWDAFVRVPRGPFLMGSADDDAEANDAEKPQHPYEIPHDYWIGRYPVTNAEFARFVESEGYTNADYWTDAGWAWREAEERVAPDGWKDDRATSHPRHPVVNVTWYEAVAYTRWLTARLRQQGLIEETQAVRLPSEAEWEKAARGEYGRVYPWGDDWDPARCNSKEGGPGAPTPVGHYSPEGDSPYGAADMAGNVWEWCATQWVGDYREYAEREDNALDGASRRVVRGGSFDLNRGLVRCACRLRFNPDGRSWNLGFRLAVAPTASGR